MLCEWRLLDDHRTTHSTQFGTVRVVALGGIGLEFPLASLLYIDAVDRSRSYAHQPSFSHFRLALCDHDQSVIVHVTNKCTSTFTFTITITINK